MATLEEDAWKRVKRWAEEEGSSNDRCLLDLLRRLETLEQRATEPPAEGEAVELIAKLRVYAQGEEDDGWVDDASLFRRAAELLERQQVVKPLEQRATPAPEPAQEWIERRIYKNSIEYSEYIKQRFQDRTSLSFVFDGHRWQYRYSSFDDAGDYDLIFRPSVPKPAPAPAADRRLWKLMSKAYRHKLATDSTIPTCIAAEIDAVADWIKHQDPSTINEVIGLLRNEARLAREGK